MEDNKNNEVNEGKEESKFDFLNKVVIPTVKPSKGEMRVTKAQPTKADIRVYLKDGRVFINQELVDELKMYEIADDSKGIDIWTTLDWGGYYPKEKPAVMLASFIKKHTKDGAVSKIGLVVTNRKIEGNKTPKPEAGLSPSFGKELLDMYFSTYVATEDDTDVDAWNEKLQKEGIYYIDLVIDKDIEVGTSDGIVYVPKKITRGKDKGQARYVRRENVQVFLVKKYENE